MIMSKMEESKRDKLLQNIQDNTDILCKLGAVIIVLLIIIAFQLFYQLLQLERYKGNDMSLEEIFNWIQTVNILWILLPILVLGILLFNLKYIADNFGTLALWLGLLVFLWIFPEKFGQQTFIYSLGVQGGKGTFLAQ